MSYWLPAKGRQNLKIIVDCFGVRDGGGSRLVEILVTFLGICRPSWQWVWCVEPEVKLQLMRAGVPDNVLFVVNMDGSGWLTRYRWLNQKLPRLAVRLGADMLFCFANLPPIVPVVPTVLLIQQMKALEAPSKAGFRNGLRLRLLNHYIRRAAPAAQKIVVQSQEMRLLLGAQIPSVSSRIEVIPSPVLVENVGESRPDTVHVFSRLGRPCIAYISLPRPHKNHINLIRALALVHKTNPEVTLALTATGPDKGTCDPVIRSLHQEIKASGVDHAVAWLGVLNASEVADLYRSADILIFPSLKESFGLPLAEAMSIGRPVLASDLAFAHEILGDAGVYFTPDQPADIAKAILSFLLDAQLRSVLRKNAEARRHLFSPPQISQRLCALFESVVGGEGFL